MRKAQPGQLPDLLKGYIGIVTVTTARAIIMIRQCFYRHGKGEPIDTPLVMFPSITRVDADKGIPQCLKFLFNYGFYKFGLEFCLMGLVALIGTRLDFISVLYGIWLLILFAMKRTITARIWPFFQVFAIIALPIQYAFVVAPPTWLCIGKISKLNGKIRICERDGVKSFQQTFLRPKFIHFTLFSAQVFYFRLLRVHVK